RRAGAPDLRVAVHARFGGRHVGKTGRLDTRVTVPAIDPQSADMVRMAEGHRLFARLHGARLVTGAVQLGKSPGEEAQNKNRAKNRDSGKRVGAVVKDLGHLSTWVPAR